jgi:hypothetical protein
MLNLCGCHSATVDVGLAGTSPDPADSGIPASADAASSSGTAIEAQRVGEPAVPPDANAREGAAAVTCNVYAISAELVPTKMDGRGAAAGGGDAAEALIRVAVRGCAALQPAHIRAMVTLGVAVTAGLVPPEYARAALVLPAAGAATTAFPRVLLAPASRLTLAEVDFAADSGVQCQAHDADQGGVYGGITPADRLLPAPPGTAAPVVALVSRDADVARDAFVQGHLVPRMSARPADTATSESATGVSSATHTAPTHGAVDHPWVKALAAALPPVGVISAVMQAAAALAPAAAAAHAAREATTLATLRQAAAELWASDGRECPLTAGVLLTPLHLAPAVMNARRHVEGRTVVLREGDRTTVLTQEAVIARLRAALVRPGTGHSDGGSSNDEVAGSLTSQAAYVAALRAYHARFGLVAPTLDAVARLFLPHAQLAAALAMHAGVFSDAVARDILRAIAFRVCNASGIHG